jgi:hypothetical protein
MHTFMYLIQHKAKKLLRIVLLEIEKMRGVTCQYEWQLSHGDIFIATAPEIRQDAGDDTSDRSARSERVAFVDLTFVGGR